MTQELKRKFSIYLIKESYTEIENIIPENHGMLRYEISDSQGELGILYLKTDYESVPKWASLFAGIFSPSEVGLKAISARAVLVIKIQNRIMCLTFGHAQHLIESLSIVKNFGLKVALNLGGETTLRGVDKTSLDLITIQSKEQSSKEVGINDFNFNFEMDILKSITVKDVEESSTISGRDLLSINAAITLDTMREFLEDILECYGSDNYKKKFAWVDYICPERDKAVIENLNSILIEKINSSDVMVWMAVPEVINWEDIQGFTYKKSRSPAPSRDISLANWKRAIVKDDDVIDLEYLKKNKVNIYDVNFQILRRWSVFQCLNAEIDYYGNKYILNDTEWYKVDNDFVANINDSFDSLQESSVSLPPFGAMKEPEYNRFVVNQYPDLYALMDAENINIGGGRSKIEFCDLFSSNNRIIHVKKYGGSSVLSHLFQQGVVSGELMRNSQTFREKVNEKLSEEFRFADVSVLPNASDYEICYAIMSDVPGDLHIPFFSKVVLKNAANRLRAYGYRVTKKKICIQ